MYTYNNLLKTVQQYFAEENLNEEPAGLFDPIVYTMGLGGKRIRPLLMLAAADLFGGNVDQVRNAAIGIELFHNFTLLHDDLMDQSPLRRGQPTVYCKWNANTAILSGDTMFCLAWRYMLRSPKSDNAVLLDTFNEICMGVCKGQQYDMDFETRDDITLDDYLEMIRLKTAVLLAGALKIGALHTSAAPADIENLYRFGIAIGIAFQLRDDLLDAWGDVSSFGKQNGTDIKDNKKTYLYLSALAKGNEEEKAQLRSLFATTPQDPAEKIGTVIGLYNKQGIRQETEQAIARYHKEAEHYLAAIQVDETRKETLRDIAALLLDRNR